MPSQIRHIFFLQILYDGQNVFNENQGHFSSPVNTANPSEKGKILLEYRYCRWESTLLPVVLYGCETWSLTLKGYNRLRVFENRVQRRICGPKKDVVTREWKKLHNEEFHNLYCLKYH
jgi:hypothetical protein